MTIRVTKIRTQAGEALKKAALDLDNNKKKGMIGWLENAKYIKGQQVAYIAAIQDQGYSAKNIPARPILKPTLIKNQNVWHNLIKNGLLSLLQGKITVEQILNDVVERGAGDLRKEIKSITSPPLSKRTIAARLSKRKNKRVTKTLGKPLVDSGVLLNTVKGSVIDK